MGSACEIKLRNVLTPVGNSVAACSQDEEWGPSAFIKKRVSQKRVSQKKVSQKRVTQKKVS